MKRGRVIVWDRLFALVIALVGAFVAWQGSSYSFGELARIGPGFFPVMIGGSLAACGLAIAVRTGGEGADTILPRLRGLVLLPAAVLAFILLLERTGIVPATLVMTLLSSQADPETGPWTTGLILIAAVAIAAGIFHFGFGIPVPLFRWSL